MYFACFTWLAENSSSNKNIEHVETNLAPGKHTEFIWDAGQFNSQVVVGNLRLGLGKWAKVEFQERFRVQRGIRISPASGES